jgi:hypothetical protein
MARLASEVYTWIEFFAGSAVATKCVLGAGYTGPRVDLKYGAENFWDILSDSGMAS